MPRALQTVSFNASHRSAAFRGPGRIPPLPLTGVATPDSCWWMESNSSPPPARKKKSPSRLHQALSEKKKKKKKYTLTRMGGGVARIVFSSTWAMPAPAIAQTMASFGPSRQYRGACAEAYIAVPRTQHRRQRAPKHAEEIRDS